MRIAHFIDTDCKGGAEVTLMDLCTYQKQAGHEVVVIHKDNAFLQQACEQNGIEQAEIPAHRLYKSTKTLPFYGLSFAKTLRRLRVDVLHSHLFGPITGNALPARLSGTRHIGTLHDVYTVEEKPARAKLLALSHRLGTRLVCVSKHMAEYYRSQLNTDEKALGIIYNAARSPVPLRTEQLRSLRHQYGVEPEETLVIAVGRLVPLKRQDLIIKALSMTGDRDTRLLVVGEGPELGRLRRLAASLAVEARVIFTGQIADVPALLQAADLFVQFSSTEGLSRSIIEAMSCRLPCIVSDVGGNSELVEDQRSGEVVPPDRLDVLIERMNRLVGDPGLRSRYGAHAHERFNQRFEYERFQRAYLNAYSAPWPQAPPTS